MKNPFNLKNRRALTPPRDDDTKDEGWEEAFEDRQKLFSDSHNHLLSLRQSSFEKSDELIVAVSSAFLGLSVGFIKDIVPLNRSIWLPLLVLSWFCFFGAILTNFVSHFWARNAIEDQIDCARYYYLEGRTKYLDPGINKWTLLTERCNAVAAILFGAGVLLTLLFVSANVFREGKYQSAKSANSDESTQAQSGTKTNTSNTRGAHAAPRRTHAPATPQRPQGLNPKP